MQNTYQSRKRKTFPKIQNIGCSSRQCFSHISIQSAIEKKYKQNSFDIFNPLFHVLSILNNNKKKLLQNVWSFHC